MKENELIKWIKCKECGYIQHCSHLRCLNCKCRSFEDFEAYGDLKLITYTILKAPPKEFRDHKEYAIGIAEFENRVKIMGQISRTEDLRTGMDLRPQYGKLCDNLDGNEVYAYKFKPI